MLTKILLSFCAFLQLTAAFVPTYDKISVKFYNGLNSHHFNQYSMQNLTRLLSDKTFHYRKPTVLWINGWMLSPTADTSVQLIDAYRKYQDVNLLVLDWSDYNVGLYTMVMFRMFDISRIVGRHLTMLFRAGLNEKNFMCVGHSFGAHSCGIIGREVQKSSNGRFKLARITGLDPAGPNFFPPLHEEPLGRSDANFVDTIHSDVFFIGTKYPLGHATFYPNYNQTQPGCPQFRFESFLDFVNNMCNHNYAIRYFVRTLNPINSKMFLSTKCSDFQSYQARKCDRNPTNFMGNYVNPNVQGVFFLKTTASHFFNGLEFYNWILKRIGDRAAEVFSFDFESDY